MDVRAALAWSLGAAVQAVLLVVTALPVFRPVLGVPTWHHNASLVLVLLGLAPFGRRMWTDRRLLGLGVAVTTLLALVSAFLLLYLKDDLKAWLLKDWAKWWHIAWSWAALAFFLGHTWANRAGLARALRRIATGLGGLWFWVPIGLALVAIPLTWSPWGAAAIQDPNYILLTHYTWLAVAGPSYVAWLVVVVRSRGGLRPAWASRVRVQAFVDAWLLPMTILANASGFPILYFGTKDTDLKYVAKYWHTWPSIAMAVLVFAHTIQFWPGMRRHMRASAGARTEPARTGLPRHQA